MTLVKRPTKHTIPLLTKSVISRDVSFQEHYFPYHFHTPPSSSFSKFYLPLSTPISQYDAYDFLTPPNPDVPPFNPPMLLVQHLT